MFRASKQVSILLVEDDDIDVRIIERGFRKCRIASPIVRARDGLEGLQILRGEGDIPRPAWPFIVLLDINMPRMDGFEFLDELRRDPDLFGITVFVLTTSDANRDKFAAYSKHVAGYLVKSDSADQFANVISMISSYIDTVRFTDSPVLANSPASAAGP